MKKLLSIMSFYFLALCLQSFAICPSVDAQQYTIIDLGTLSGGYFAQAAKINESGRIAGTSERNDSSPEIHAFLWTKQDGMMDLGNLYEGDTIATSINNRKQVVGYEYYENAEPLVHTFLWSKKTGMLDLGTLGGIYSQARGINGRGQIVGSSTNHEGDWRAFLWDEKDGMQDIGTLGGDTFAWGINDPV